MKVGFVGLGLIGGSMAKAYKESGHRVLGYDLNEATLGYCSLAGITDGVLDENSIPECDLIFIALYPISAIKYLEEIAHLISKNATVIDLCGTKAKICECGFALAKKHGFTFVGGHPMAGTQYSGIKHARASLFRNAPMVLVPPVYDDIAFLDGIKQLLAPAGFGKTSFTTAIDSYAATHKCDMNNHQGFKVLQIYFEDDDVDITRKHFARITQTEARFMKRLDIANRDEIENKLMSHPDKDMIAENLRLKHFRSGTKTASDIEVFIKNENYSC